MAKLSEEQLKAYGDKLGKEKVTITAAMLVDILNHKHGGKSNDKPFKFNDIQQYYLRGSIPKKYGGHKIELKTDDLGNKTLIVYKDKEE